jgi:putative flippase GtrA
MFNGSNPLAWFRDPEFRRFVTFLAVGGLNTLVGYLIFGGLVLIGLSATAAIVVGTALGVTFNYFSTGGIVFRDRTAGKLPRFLAVYLVQMGLNIAAMRGLEHAGLHPLIAGAVLLPPLAIFTFLAMRRFVFT